MSDEHYFTADPAVAFRRERVRAEVWDRTLELDSGSGVFAVGRVDVATAILLRETSRRGAWRGCSTWAAATA